MPEHFINRTRCLIGFVCLIPAAASVVGALKADNFNPRLDGVYPLGSGGAASGQIVYREDGPNNGNLPLGQGGEYRIDFEWRGLDLDGEGGPDDSVFFTLVAKGTNWSEPSTLHADNTGWGVNNVILEKEQEITVWLEDVNLSDHTVGSVTFDGFTGGRMLNRNSNSTYSARGLVNGVAYDWWGTDSRYTTKGLDGISPVSELVFTGVQSGHWFGDPWLDLAVRDFDLQFTYSSETTFGMTGQIQTRLLSHSQIELKFEEFYKPGIHREFRTGANLQDWQPIEPDQLIKGLPVEGRQSISAVLPIGGDRAFYRVQHWQTSNPPSLDPVYVQVHLARTRQVGNIAHFDRKRHITLHASHTEREWQHGIRDADNFTDNLLADFILGRDVYFGRNSGLITWYAKNEITQDPARPGWADPASIAQWGAHVRQDYEENTDIHPYESRSDEVLVAQFEPFWPDGTPTSKGWAFSQADTAEEPFGTAVGDFMGRFTNHFYDRGGLQSGQPAPPYIEIINEPEWDLLDNPTNPPTPPDLIWKFHKNVAQQLRAHNDQALIGGYTTTFPDLDKDNFREWNEEWKSFIDIAGSSMDFWSLHIYDWPTRNIYRKGGYIEAMFDMIDYYSEATLGIRRPYVISEYGAQSGWPLLTQPWSSWRDWLKVQSTNAMLMSFLERPDLMLKTIPFMVVKGEWGRHPTTGNAYTSRLMRQANEPASNSGEWIYSDFIYFYDLWSEVNGLRIDTQSGDVDIQADAYLSGNRLFVILNNLIRNPGDGMRTIHLSPIGTPGRPVESVQVKHVYWNGQQVTMEESTHPGELASVQIGGEAAIVLKYTFASEPMAPELVTVENKYFSTEYLWAIDAGSAVNAEIPGVATADLDRAILRIGIGRAQARSKSPVVVFNGTELTVPYNLLGYDGDSRENFFGILQVPVPPHIVQESNQVAIIFPDSGGHVSTVALRTFRVVPSNLQDR